MQYMGKLHLANDQLKFSNLMLCNRKKDVSSPMITEERWGPVVLLVLCTHLFVIDQTFSCKQLSWNTADRIFKFNVLHFKVLDFFERSDYQA